MGHLLTTGYQGWDSVDTGLGYFCCRYNACRMHVVIMNDVTYIYCIRDFNGLHEGEIVPIDFSSSSKSFIDSSEPKEKFYYPFFFCIRNEQRKYKTSLYML